MVDAVVVSHLGIKKFQSIMDIANKAKAYNIPLIVIDGEIEGAFNITFGYTDAITRLTNHIIEHHHATRINFMGGSNDNEVSLARQHAYEQCLEAHGIPVEKKRITYGLFWSEPAKDEFKKYYETYNELPEAVVCANDSMAIGICQAVKELGFNVPKDVMVTGLDGIREAMNYSPTITTARYNFKEMAEVISNVLDDYFNGTRKDLVESIVIESEVVYAGSCGCTTFDKALDNQLKRDLYANIDFYNIFCSRVNELIERCSGASSLNDTILRLHDHILSIWSSNVWICLNESYMNDESSTFNNMGYTNNGYELNSNCVIYRHDKSCTALGTFKTSKMLPNIENELSDTSFGIMFCPLNNQDKTLGYIAVTYDNNFNDGLFKYNNLLKSIVMVLENAKIQSELKHTVSKLENMYIRDAMTSIYNRRGFYQLVPDLITRCVAEDKYLMVLSVDLDGLKPINDIHGHNEGDNAIITVAKTLSSIAINNEIVSRFGGDEYVVAGICDEPDYAQHYVNRFNDFLEYYNQNSHKPYKISASTGIYCKKVDSANGLAIDELIKIADETMYIQKQSKHYNRGR
jgi:diguanylate cyclase (GGDEF)-like protein